MKAARKARQNTLGTARRKAHTPRHTQRRITAESTRRRLAPASLHTARHLCRTRAKHQRIAENARRDTPSAASQPKAHAADLRQPACTRLDISATRVQRHRIAGKRIRRDTPSAASQPKAHAADLHQLAHGSTSLLRAPSATASPRKRTPRHSSIRCPCYTRAKHQRIAENARRDTPSAPARRDGRASEAPAIHSLSARTLRLYYSAFCVQMRDIILPRGALFHHFLNVYTKGRPAAAKDTPPGDRPRAFIRFCR